MSPADNVRMQAAGSRLVPPASRPMPLLDIASSLPASCIICRHAVPMRD